MWNFLLHCPYFDCNNVDLQTKFTDDYAKKIIIKGFPGLYDSHPVLSLLLLLWIPLIESHPYHHSLSDPSMWILAHFGWSECHFLRHVRFHFMCPKSRCDMFFLSTRILFLFALICRLFDPQPLPALRVPNLGIFDSLNWLLLSLIDFVWCFVTPSPLSSPTHFN